MISLNPNIKTTPLAINRPLKIAYLLSHPIQYQSAMLKELSTEPDLDLKVFYGMDTCTKGSFDEGFGRNVSWDVPLLDGYEYEFLPTLIPGANPSQLRPVNRGFRSRLQEGKFDLVWLHGWGRLADLLALHDAKSLGLPVLMRTENNFLGSPPMAGMIQGLKEHLKRWVLDRCDVFGYMGKAGHDYFRAYGIPEWQLFDLPYMVDNVYWQRQADNAAKDRQTLYKRHDMTDQELPVFIFVGKFQTRKRVIDLVEAYARLSVDGLQPPEAYLLIVGSGEQQQELEAKVKALGWDRIILAGFRNQAELPAYFELADVFVIPSANEQWGVVVNEAMNCNCAVVASDECGSAPNLVIDGQTGYQFPTGDIAALTVRLRQLIADQQQLRKMQQQARELVASFNTARILLGLRSAILYLYGKERLPGIEISSAEETDL